MNITKIICEKCKQELHNINLISDMYILNGLWVCETCFIREKKKAHIDEYIQKYIAGQATDNDKNYLIDAFLKDYNSLIQRVNQIKSVRIFNKIKK